MVGFFGLYLLVLKVIYGEAQMNNVKTYYNILTTRALLFCGLVVCLFSFVPNLYCQSDTIQAQSYFLNGRALYEEGKILEAEKNFEKVVAIFGKSNPNTQYYLIKCSLYKEEYEKVRDVLLKDYFASYQHSDPTNPMYMELVMLVSNLEGLIKVREDRITDELIVKTEKAIHKYNNYFSGYSGNNNELFNILELAVHKQQLTKELLSIIDLVVLLRNRTGQPTSVPRVRLKTFDPLALLIPSNTDSERKKKLTNGWFPDVLGNSIEVFDVKEEKYVKDANLVRENFNETNFSNGYQYSICFQNKSATERYVYTNGRTYSFIHEGQYKLFNIQLWPPSFIFKEGQKGEIKQLIVVTFQSSNKEANTLVFSTRKSAGISNFEVSISWNDKQFYFWKNSSYVGAGLYFIIDNVSNRILFFTSLQEQTKDIEIQDDDYESYKIFQTPQGVSSMAYYVAGSFSCGGGGCKDIKSTNYRFNFSEKSIYLLLKGIQFLNQELEKYFTLDPIRLNLK
jgi:tetratricopeptide (TPR) repeat protein